MPREATANAARGETGRGKGSFGSRMEVRSAAAYSSGIAHRIPSSRPSLGNLIAPPRFLLFAVVLLTAAVPGIALLGWAVGWMAAFDVAAGVFLIACMPLLRYADADAMRRSAARNDANRVMLLGISAVALLAVLAAVASELGGKQDASAGVVALIVATLVLAWLFGNSVYALHYAHLYYLRDDAGKDAAGIDFPGTDEPEYWDFVYFAFTLGMTFQTSDVEITRVQLRKVATAHCLLAFVFNLGVLAFTINVLGG